MRLLRSVVIIGAITLSTQAADFYVDANSTAFPADGLTWATAFLTIQEGIDAAEAAGGGEVWVARGIYSGSAGNPLDTGGIPVGDTTLILRDGVHLYGGFVGNELLLSERSWEVNATIIDGETLRRGVYSANIPTSGATLDGFTIRNCVTPEYGGGVYNDRSSLHIENCAISMNSAGLHGGGIFNYLSDDVTIVHSRIRQNTASYGGGGIYTNSVRLLLEDTVIFENTARYGGGIYDIGSDTLFRRCPIAVNNATISGGGYCYEGLYNTEFRNCLIADNSAVLSGGGIYHDGNRLFLTNCTVADNTAASGGGYYCETSFSLLMNTILWNNGASNFVDPTGDPFNMIASCIQFITPDPVQNIIADNPLFVDALLNDYRLDHSSFCVDTGVDDWVLIPDDILATLRPQGIQTDIGAYEILTVTPNDSDGDMLPDAWELEQFYTLVHNGASDSDGDTLRDEDEFPLGTSPNYADTDGDELDDAEEIGIGTDPLLWDTDGDGLPDGWEVSYTLDPFITTGEHGADGDPDGDGFTNLEEYELGTNPRDPQSVPMPSGQTWSLFLAALLMLVFCCRYRKA